MDVSIPVTITDPATRRFIEDLLKVIRALEDRVKLLEVKP